MKTCRQCGVTLADQAQFCMQCGTAVDSDPPVETQTESTDFLKPALIAGALLGALSSIPIINLGNCICCMWVFGGGGFGAWLMGRDRPGGSSSLTYGDGAFVGALSGLFGALVATVLSIPMMMLRSVSSEELETMLIEMIPDIDPEMLEMFGQLSQFTPVAVIMNLLIYGVSFSLFAMIGGILYVAITQKK